MNIVFFETEETNDGIKMKLDNGNYVFVHDKFAQFKNLNDHDKIKKGVFKFIKLNVNIYNIKRYNQICWFP